MHASTITPFLRDRLTWQSYFLIAYLAYLQAALGPLMPFFRAEHSYGYAEVSWHFSAPAIGGILTGIFGARLVLRFGRKAAIWLGGAGMALGYLLLMYSSALPLSVGGMILAGLAGTLLQSATQSALSDQHGERRAYALTELNVSASLAALTAPLLIGGFEGVGIGWRAALHLCVAYLACLWLIFWRVRVPMPAQTQAAHALTKPLPYLFWAYVLVLVLVVSIEWSVIYWGADFLERAVGFERVTASTLMTFFFIAMLVGRIIGSRLTRRYSNTTLLLLAMCLAIGGFFLLWSAPMPTLNVLGLFVAGLGMANLFPQSISLALSIAAEQADAANARVALGVSLSLLLAPQLLGNLADQIGIRSAYGSVLIFQLATLVLILLANRAMRRRQTALA
ncbi:MAG: MFS transporter [Anaerolineae bacterium]|nr:MFS transporter [Anaerolineae bacterium]MDW8298644.1 MFS transporter [Anaerolineae bacterium]